MWTIQNLVAVKARDRDGDGGKDGDGDGVKVDVLSDKWHRVGRTVEYV